MARLKTMTTQFIDGEPNGVRICRCTLSTMTTVFVPRPLLSRAKQIADLPMRGIYYLINDEDGAISRLYVGQTKQGIARLDDHNAKKDFWNKAILFLSDDIQSFSLDNVSALEKFAIEQATASKRYTVENKVDPRYVIDQYQKPTVEQIYEEIAFVMGTFGYQIEDSDDALVTTLKAQVQDLQKRLDSKEDEVSELHRLLSQEQQLARTEQSKRLELEATNTKLIEANTDVLNEKDTKIQELEKKLLEEKNKGFWSRLFGR